VGVARQQKELRRRPLLERVWTAKNLANIIENARRLGEVFCFMDLLLFSLAQAFTLGKREAFSPRVFAFSPLLRGEKAKTHDQRQPWSPDAYSKTPGLREGTRNKTEIQNCRNLDNVFSGPDRVSRLKKRISLQR
jgi:hypothetical protein